MRAPQHSTIFGALFILADMLEPDAVHGRPTDFLGLLTTVLKSKGLCNSTNSPASCSADRRTGLGVPRTLAGFSTAAPHSIAMVCLLNARS